MTEDDEYPPLTSLSELWTAEELAAKLQITKKLLADYRFRASPKLPYLRFGAHIFFVEAQVVWFLNRWQKEHPDPYNADRMRRARRGNFGFQTGQPKRRKGQPK